jgi:hypothetical protein
MNIFKKIIPFVIAFSALFYFVRTSDYYNGTLLITDVAGVPWLYSTIGAIFSIIAAFTIQKEWDNWNKIVETVKSEVDSLEELWMWTDHLPAEIAKKSKELITEYLKVLIREWRQKSERGERSETAEKTLYSLRNTTLEVAKIDSQLAPISFSLFSNLMRHRNDRLHLSVIHTPDVLRHTLIFSTSLLVLLSLLIGIKDIWLDYIFTLSIATLAYTVYTVIIDLDNPLRPGGWHLTTKDYEDLLKRIDKSSSQETVNLNQNKLL